MSQIQLAVDNKNGIIVSYDIACQCSYKLIESIIMKLIHSTAIIWLNTSNGLDNCITIVLLIFETITVTTKTSEYFTYLHFAL